jgi:hypothetical protein
VHENDSTAHGLGVFRNEWFERLIFGESEDDHLSLLLPAELAELAEPQGQ